MMTGLGRIERGSAELVAQLCSPARKPFSSLFTSRAVRVSLAIFLSFLYREMAHPYPQLAITSSTWIQRGIFLMESKRWIHIVSFLNFIQKKGQGRQGKPMEKQIAIFDD